jgi:molybdopterin converting factor small subunit
MFASAREAAGTGRDDVPGATVAEVLAAASARYGAAFAHVLETCRVWVNGEEAAADQVVGPADEVAVLPPVSGGSGDEAPTSLDTVRDRRRALQERDDAISYVRRVAQARGDLARAEQERRAGSSGGTAGGAARDVAQDVGGVLAERLLGGDGRPPRPAEDFSDDPRAVELDELCARLGFARLDELADAELADLVAALDRFETDVSADRHAVHAELDQLTDALVEGYRDRYEGVGREGDDDGGNGPGQDDEGER